MLQSTTFCEGETDKLQILEDRHVLSFFLLTDISFFYICLCLFSAKYLIHAVTFSSNSFVNNQAKNEGMSVQKYLNIISQCAITQGKPFGLLKKR